MKYLQLDPRRIVETAEALERRIAERFPQSGLSRVAGELSAVARDAVRRSARMQRSYWPLHFAVAVLIVGFIAGVILLLNYIRLKPEEPSLSDLIQDADALLASTVFIGASVIFLLTLDTRLKRRRVLEALHELRSLAHIVDMHQLTKDPEIVASPGPATASSPKRTLSPFELGRYLDYSSEMLSILSKIAALYVQGFEDPQALNAVDEVENLTNGLSRKIWQKIMILDRMIGQPPAGAPAREKA